MMNVSTARITIHGDKDLMRALRRLSDRVEKTVVLKALRKVARPIVGDARSRVPVRWGHLKKSLGIKTKKYKTGARSAIAVIGARSKLTTRTTATGKQIRINPAMYSHLVEGGTSPHTLPTITVGRGKVTWHYWDQSAAPKPFLKPALDANVAAVLRNLGAEIWAQIRRIAGKP